MPDLVTQVSTTVIRDGKRVSPALGVSFKYTDEEAEYIRKVSGPLALRKPVNESPVVENDATQPRENTETGEKIAKPAKGDKPSRGAKVKDAADSKDDAARKAAEAEKNADDSDDDEDEDGDI